MSKKDKETGRPNTTIDTTRRLDKDWLAALCFANCEMILQNAISMPDSYIKEFYGSDDEMCKVAERYFDFGCSILKEMPYSDVKAITTRSPLRKPEEEDKKDFLEFLWQVINPNEMEDYMRMYIAEEGVIDEKAD